MSLRADDDDEDDSYCESEQEEGERGGDREQQREHVTSLRLKSAENRRNRRTDGWTDGRMDSYK